MRTAIRGLLSLLLLIVVLFFGAKWWLRRSVPQRDGTVRTAVAAPVEITFDAKGIPQIWAKTDADAFFAMGWLHASDRLFQMELVRRLTQGRLAEIFGEPAIETDVDQRRIGFARAAVRDEQRLDPETRLALERYVAGVNHWIAHTPVLPPEFVVLRVKPEPWKVADCLAVMQYQTWYSHQLMDNDERYQKLVEKLGDAGQQLVAATHPWSPPTVPDSFADRVLGATGMRATAASNSWVVAPSHSASGFAMHASDPHVAIDQAPGLWYFAGVHSAEGLNVVGATYAGVPFVAFGHNDQISYALTVASVDVIDYYDEPPGSVISSTTENVRVKGEERPRTIRIERTARGVIVRDGVSMKWAGFDSSIADAASAGRRLQRARTFDEFRALVTRFGALDTNWMYSDRAGHIGYQLGAPIPIRDFDSFARQKASDPNTVWRGYRPLAETPYALDPPQGFLATCNNQVVGAQWPYPLPGFYDPYRIPRAVELLSANRKLTREDMRQIQLDLASGIAARWQKLAAAGAQRAGKTAEARLLGEWDGRMSADSKAATLFTAWWRSLAQPLFEDELGAQYADGRVVQDSALSTHSKVIDDRRTPQVETEVDISARAIELAIPRAGGRTWGEASTLTVRHPLARAEVLDRLLSLSRGPFPMPGDAGSLNANFHSFDEKTNSFRSRIGASLRFVLDWADPDAFTLTGALGQSGNPFSPHYDDFLAMSRSGEAWTVPFTREKVFARRASLLRLEPQ